jgi:hypothetical protein
MKCNCENLDCKHEPSKCKNEATTKAIHVGFICAECADYLPVAHIKWRCQCGRWHESQVKSCYYDGLKRP